MRRRADLICCWDEEIFRTFPPDKHHLVGVSGGRDSVVLLHRLLAQGYRKLIICHLDHRLRGRASTADARFVARLAAARGLTFETASVDVRRLATDSKQSLETAARRARFEFFARVARRRRCRTIFLGHHADDLVETFLINLFRGAGAQGQRAIRAVSTRRIGNGEVTIIRPMLGVWRSEIDEYVTTHCLKFREDASNQQLDSLRNRTRHRIIPLLEKEFGRDIRISVRRAAAIAAEEDALMDELVPERMTARRLSTRELHRLPIALQRRALAKWLRAHAIADIGFEMVEKVRALLQTSGIPAKVNLTRDKHARRRAGELFIQ